jgi:uncharacterized protein YsxB (DUF464 family)
MIRVNFGLDEKKRSATLRMEGHAGLASPGQDIVCASASILAYTLAQEIKIAEERGELRYKPRLHLRGGNANISCRYKDPSILRAFLTVQTGFALLAHNYPDYVMLETMLGDEKSEEVPHGYDING